MAALCNFSLETLRENKDDQMQSLAELWDRLDLSRWDEKQSQTTELLSDPCCAAIIKLAAVVLGLPFPDKVNRLSWCTRWGSLLLTWGVARGFAADTGMRPPRVQNTQLHLKSAIGLPRGELVQEAEELCRGSDLLSVGYKLLSTTSVRARDRE